MIELGKTEDIQLLKRFAVLLVKVVMERRGQSHTEVKRVESTGFGKRCGVGRGLRGKEEVNHS